jgi:hypothetical protein
MKQHFKKHWFSYTIFVLLIGLSGYLYVHEKIAIKSIQHANNQKIEQLNKTYSQRERADAAQRDSINTKVFSWLIEFLSTNDQEQTVLSYLKDFAEVANVEEILVLNELNRVQISTNTLHQGKLYSNLSSQKKEYKVIRQEISTGSVVFLFYKDNF